MNPEPGPAGPTEWQPPGADPRARDIIEHIVQAVGDGDDARIRTLLADLAAVADTTALLHLRERLYGRR
ncbi:hypothetical protein ABZ957_33225 [Streptomyces sp. NPDC046316]|uniref:hypothetical protein n=1 Tax=Streptomyces sp. NPDC046316 TaxID=3154494 RepID=UPI0033C14BB5